MINHMQNCGKSANPSEAEAKSDNAGMLNTGISKQSFIAFLDKNNQSGYHDGK